MSKLLNLLRSRRARMESDLDRELRYHVERRVSDVMRTGVSETEARRRVGVEFGGVVQAQEEVRDTWTWEWLDAFMRDVRYACRSLTRDWGFALGAGAVLALGIGTNTAIFSVVNTVLLRPLAYPDADRIVALDTVWTNSARTEPEVSGPDFLDWRAQSDSFAALAYSVGEDDMATVVSGRAEFANVRYVSSDFFAVFGQPPAAGRRFAAEDVPSGDKRATVAIVGYGWAERHFGSAQAAVGKSVTVYGDALQIVGVAAQRFRYPGATDIWSPDGPTNSTNRAQQVYYAVGRVKPGVEFASAATQLRTVSERAAQQYPENRFKSVSVTPLQAQLTGNVRTTLWMLMGAVGLVLLIGCANVANLLVARSASRTSEIALRTALGAGRGRVVRQLLTESFVLAAAAASVGLLLAWLFLAGLVALLPANLPRVDEIGVDMNVLLFALGLSLISTLLFGLLPAFGASRLDLSSTLKQGGARGAVSSGSRRLRSALVVTEVALSLVLLAASGLLLRSFQVLNQVDLGFTTDRVIAVYTQYVVASRDDARRRVGFYQDALERVRGVPGVADAAGMAFLPFGREPRPPFEYFIEGQPVPPPGQRPKATLQAITPGYFGTLKIPFRAGRDFAAADRPSAARVAIVNEALAHAAFGSESAIGKHVRAQRPDGPPIEIVGVVADTRWHGAGAPGVPELFLHAQQGETGMGGSLSLLVRTTLDDAAMASSVRALLGEINPTLPVRFETMNSLFSDSLAYPRFRTRLVAAFAAMAALLAAVGIFSVLAYLVGQRRKELAVRRAIGAQSRDVVRLIVGQGLRMAGVGLVLGLVTALALARVLSGLLFEISPWDVATYAGATALLGLVAVLATLLPAMRAATVSPLMALRGD